MKSISSKCVLRSLAAVAMVVTGSSVFAVQTWDLYNSPSGVAISGYSNNSGTSTSAPTATNNAANFQVATVGNYGAPPTASSVGGGLGITATNELGSASGPHAIDNGFGIDAMLLNFTTGPVNLTSLTIGWNGTDNPCISANNGTGACGTTASATALNYNDSDLSVFYWNGTVAGAPTLTSKSPTTLMAANSGWSLVNNYANVGSNASQTQAPLGTAVYSSYWLISAYSSAYGSGTGLDQGTGSNYSGYDAFKLLSVAGTVQTTPPPAIPEPGSLALMGAAMVGFMATRRRKVEAV